MLRLRLSLVLILILGLSLVAADYEEESEEENEENEENTSSDDSDEPDDDVTLTKYNCANGLKSAELAQMCCHGHLHLDKASRYCYQHEDVSDLDYSTKKGQLEQITRLIGCFFRRKNYIKSENRMNMKQVQADAAKLRYPAKAKFMLKMYKTCEGEGRQALRLYDGYSEETVKNLQTTPHQMYEQVIYICVNNYFKEKECPYFHWFSDSEGDHVLCQRYAKECKKLVGNK